jgi:alkylated DNA repair dioxygenase AlkB
VQRQVYSPGKEKITEQKMSPGKTLSLFDYPYDKNNLLPADGTVIYYGRVLDDKQADFFYRYLLNDIPWKNDEAIMFGKRIITKRKVAWYGDKAFEYAYSNHTKTALPFTDELLRLKRIAEEHTGHTYNSCLLNLYHDGKEGMAWHSDAEKDLKKHGAIASMSFGAKRKFAFKHKTSKEKVALMLEHGSLLVMKDETQDHWLHRLPPTVKINAPRVNLTFRTIID